VNWGEKGVSESNPAWWGLPQAGGDSPQPQYLRENCLSNAFFSFFLAVRRIYPCFPAPAH
jgi:hypothetical protein